MDRLETRELAYFLAVADELHFGRAAARLGIAQPALSKTIQRLERRLGVNLFDRAKRTVTLTEAGQVLSHEARTVLDAISAAAARTQRAGAADPHLVLPSSQAVMQAPSQPSSQAIHANPTCCRSKWSSLATGHACCAKARQMRPSSTR